MVDTWRSREEPRRLDALRAVMERRGLSAIVVVGGHSLAYFSGFAGLERSMARPMLYVLPRTGEPWIVAHTFRRHLLEAHSWVRRFAWYTRLCRAPVEAFAQVLTEAGVAAGPIGFELGGESQINMPFAAFDDLRRAFPGHPFVDVAAEVQGIRAVRSPDEIARHRAAAAIVEGVFADAWSFVRAGTTQGALVRFVQARLSARGSGPGFVIVSAGAENYHFCGAWTPDRVFAPGDMVWMDIGATAGGYAMLFSRAGVIGGPTAEQRRIAAAVHAATRAGVEAVCPGVPLAEVARRCAAALEGIEATVTTDIAALGTRYGHGIGLDFIEPPHVADYDDTVCRPGLLFAVEPGISTPEGRFHFREVVVVTDDGFETIPGPSAELVALGTIEGR